MKCRIRMMKDAIKFQTSESKLLSTFKEYTESYTIMQYIYMEISEQLFSSMDAGNENRTSRFIHDNPFHVTYPWAVICIIKFSGNCSDFNIVLSMYFYNNTCSMKETQLVIHTAVHYTLSEVNAERCSDVYCCYCTVVPGRGSPLSRLGHLGPDFK